MTAHTRSQRRPRPRRRAPAAAPLLVLAASALCCCCCSSLAQLASSQLVGQAEPNLVVTSDLSAATAAANDHDQRQQPSGRQLFSGSSQHQPAAAAASGRLQSRQFGDTINDIHIECNSDNIAVTLTTQSGFNGMIYPKGLSKNSSCMMEYHQLAANITYRLPLKSCNTMSSDVEDGIEYFNTVMVQPHRRLVTNQGRGYHVRCRYQTKERTITNQEQQLSVNLTQVTPAVMGSATMPTCTMRIYSAQDPSHEVAAENVRIGDELQLVISLDEQQEVYGLLVTNCLVRDGMNWGEQPLVDDRGCPVDEEIMPQFQYGANLTRATVTFQAHKFPYTSSVYYQCNVRLCFRDGGCRHVPPTCGGSSTGSTSGSTTGNELGRKRRWVDGGELDGLAPGEILEEANRLRRRRQARDLSMEVSSGLHVEETAAAASGAPPEATGADPMLAAASSSSSSTADQGPTAARLDGGGEASEIDGADQAAGKEAAPAPATRDRQQSDREFCMSLRKFAIAISLASLLLMTAIIIMIACMVQRRKRERLEAQMYQRQQQQQHQGQDFHHHQHHQSDHYSGPYSNRAYCRD